MIEANPFGNEDLYRIPFSYAAVMCLRGLLVTRDEEHKLRMATAKSEPWTHPHDAQYLPSETRWWPVRGDINSPTQQDYDATQAMIRSGWAAIRYGDNGLAFVPTGARIHYVHPRLLAEPDHSVLVQHAELDLTHTFIKTDGSE